MDAAVHLRGSTFVGKSQTLATIIADRNSFRLHAASGPPKLTHFEPCRRPVRTLFRQKTFRAQCDPQQPCRGRAHGLHAPAPTRLRHARFISSIQRTKRGRGQSTHSIRSATRGSTCIARRAGKKQASNATINNSNGTQVKVMTSVGVTPKS